MCGEPWDRAGAGCSVRGVHVDVLPDTLVQEFELLARDYEGPHVDRVFLLGPAGW